MILFHGTASYNLQSFIDSKPLCYPRSYLPRCKRAFCTSLSFDEAVMFALRKTPMNDLNNIGIVLEFDGSQLDKNDYIATKDSVAIRDEQEISVLKTNKLRLIAYHKCDKGKWKRINLN